MSVWGAYAKLKGSSDYVNMTIVSGQCYIDDKKIVGQNCENKGDVSYINIDKVESFDSLTLYGTRAICTAVFAPECKFKAPNEGTREECKYSETDVFLLVTTSCLVTFLFTCSSTRDHPGSLDLELLIGKAHHLTNELQQF
ncbi:unnamed protein product [Hymenolepis diminuta]|uniref:DUF5727 domain-containing protein n=1 Tax=Hymenolepis diminuta TaxID=6216 RepID=A0A0R3SZA7_HYMDI|nr:unnamed protein product [Hymenolepis diminuta]